jgi:glycerol uptake facilitator-like aquaporin
VLAQRVAAEAAGTGTLVAAVVGSGIMATRLSQDVLLLVNATATMAVLAVLIAVLGPVSGGAHLNLAVTIVEAGRRDLHPSEAAAYVAPRSQAGWPAWR